MQAVINNYWVDLFIRMMNSDVNVDRKELRDVRKKAIEARKNGYKPDSFKCYIYEILYLHHGKWIVDCYYAVKSGIHKRRILDNI